MRNENVMREFETENYIVRATAEEEFDLDLSWDEDGSTLAGLNSGEFISFCAHVEVIHKPTGAVLGEDYLGNCIYRSFDDFMDHRACAAQNRKTEKRFGRYQIYRKNRPYESCLSNSDKLRPRGFATEVKAEAWAKANVTEEYQIFPTGKCGSYFADMISSAIADARKNYPNYALGQLRTA